MEKNHDNVVNAGTVRFVRTSDGRLKMQRGQAETVCGHLMSAFPLTHPHSMIVVRDEEGEEAVVLDTVANLDPGSRKIVLEELEKSYFMPRITLIVRTDEKLNVVTMEVETDRGPRTFQIRNIRGSIRKMAKGRIVIRDVDGNRYEIQDWTSLPSSSQRYIIEYL